MTQQGATIRQLRAAAATAVAVLFFAATVAADNARWGADYFPNVTLTTHEGRTVRFYDDLIKGKIVAIDLIYTTCRYACPLETARLVQVQRVLGDRVGKDIFFYSISIDPDHDTPQVLKEYAEKYKVGPGWTFLTGKASDIELISRKLGLYSEPNPANPDGHTPSLLIGNEATGQWMRNSALDNPKFLARTIGDWLNSWRTAKNALKSYAEVPKYQFDAGRYTFTNHCAACHTIGDGDRIGPDLRGVTAARDAAWLARFIVEPDKMLAEGDATAQTLFTKYKSVRMPNLGLTKGDAAALIDYIERQSRSAVVAPTVPAVSASDNSDTVDMTSIVDAYVRMQRALNADRLDGIRDDARTIRSEAARLGSAAASIQSAASAFETAGDLNSARAAFGTLGDAILMYVKQSGASLGDTVKIAYCPMARKYWLQKGETIQNPFYGAKMSDCGRIEP